VTDRSAAVSVGRREFSERIRQRSFQISTAVSLAVITAVAVLAGVLGGDEPKTYEVGSRGAEAAAIVRVSAAIAPQFDVEIEARRFDGADQARAAVRDERVEVAVVDGDLVAREDPPDELAQALQAGARQVRLGAALRRAGLDEAEARRALDPPPLRVEAMEADDDGRSGSPSRRR
jgi:ABC-2 type transport system permease protein